MAGSVKKGWSGALYAAPLVKAAVAAQVGGSCSKVSSRPKHLVRIGCAARGPQRLTPSTGSSQISRTCVGAARRPASGLIGGMVDDDDDDDVTFNCIFMSFTPCSKQRFVEPCSKSANEESTPH